MSRKTQHTRFGDKILWKIANEDKPQPCGGPLGVSLIDMTELAAGNSEKHFIFKSFDFFNVSLLFQNHFFSAKMKISLLITGISVPGCFLSSSWIPLSMSCCYHFCCRPFPASIIIISSWLKCKNELIQIFKTPRLWFDETRRETWFGSGQTPRKILPWYLPSNNARFLGLFCCSFYNISFVQFGW